MESAYSVKMVFSKLVKLNAGHVYQIVFHVLMLNIVIFVHKDICIILKLRPANKLTHFHVTQQLLLPQQVSAYNAQYLHISKIIFVTNVF